MIEDIRKAKKLSIDDPYTFARSVDVLNECFGKNYKAWMKSGCILNEEKTLRAWFPKIAVKKDGRLKAQSSTKAWINTISEDGQTIRAYSETESVSYYVTENLVTFAKIPGQPYKYVGTFVIDYQATKPNDIIYRRITTEVDLSPWRTK